MSDERPGEQDPPTARLNLGDVAAWVQRSAQQESADDADPAPEEAPAVPEGGPRADEVAPEGSAQPAAPRAEDADADLGTQDAPAVALDVGTIEAAPPVAGGDAHDTTEPGGPPPADETFSAGQDAPSPAGVGEAGSSNDDAPASEPEEDTGNESATDTPAEQSDENTTAWSAPPTERSDQPEGDREVGAPGEGADVPPTVPVVADAVAVPEAPADGWSPDDDDVAAGLSRPGPEEPGSEPASPLLPPADPGWASPDPPLAEDIGSVEGWQTEAATPPDPGEGQAGGLEEAAASAPEPAGDNGAVERDGASSSADGGGGAGAPDPGPSPVEASPASAEGTGVDEWAGGGERADDLGSGALFELDLAKLAERARASALREAVPASEPLPPSAPGPDPTPAPPPDLFPESVTAPSAAEDEPGQLVAPGPAPLVWGDATQAFDLSWDEEDAETDSTEADTAAGRPQGKAYAPVQAAARTWPAKRPRYPRGQLREPIGILRRIRAMLGIVVVTVLLGVAAGTAVGAFIFFLAFAVRDAITAQ